MRIGKPRYHIILSIKNPSSIRPIRRHQLIKIILNSIKVYKIMGESEVYKVTASHFLAKTRYNLFKNVIRPRMNVSYQDLLKETKEEVSQE